MFDALDGQETTYSMALHYFDPETNYSIALDCNCFALLDIVLHRTWWSALGRCLAITDESLGTSAAGRSQGQNYCWL